MATAAAERMLRTIVAFNDLESEEQAFVAEQLALIYSAGMPIAPFDGVMTEAKGWAAFAPRDELKAYCAASYHAMRPADQVAFLSYVQGRAAA